MVFSFANLESDTETFNLNHVNLPSAILDGANLRNADLRDAIFDAAVSLCGANETSSDDPSLCPAVDNDIETCVDIDGAMVEGASFRNMSFNELFDETRPDAANFFQHVVGGNMQGVNFFNSNIAGLDFAGLDFTDAAIFGVFRFCDEAENVPCASFQNVTFGTSLVTDPPLIMTSIDFREVGIAGSSFDNVDLTGSDLSDVGNLCTSDVVPDCVSFSGANTRLQSVDFSDLDLTAVGFGSAEAAVTNFVDAAFTSANLSGLMLDGRDFTNASFAASDLSGVDFEGSTLADIFSGCLAISGTSVCTTFDNAQLCGVDARGATFEGSFEGTDAWPDGCTVPADFRGASFANSELATLDLRFANLTGARFDPSVDFCNDAGECLAIDGATLVGVQFDEVDFDELPTEWFQAAGIRDLSETTFGGADLSSKALSFTDFSFANLSQADLRGTDLRNTVFDDAEFAQGSTTTGGRCILEPGRVPVDLRAADLSGADFSRARNFRRGCIQVSTSTTYNARTRFPTDFSLLGKITMVPEPRTGLLRAAVLVTLGWLARRRRRLA